MNLEDVRVPPEQTPQWQVHAVRYATLPSRRSEIFLDKAPTDDGPQSLDYFLWALISQDRVIVVDTGCRREIAERRGRTYLREPHLGLVELGVDVEAVKDVIITHLHYDHAGNLQKYPAAKFHLQEREMHFATGRMMCGGPIFSGAIEQDDIVAMVQGVFAQRVNFIDGDAQIAPGVNVRRVGGHTPGTQAVQVWTARGWVVLASDSAHLYENIRSGRPFHIVADVGEMKSGWHALRSMASSADHIVPGHDPLVMKQYPSSGSRTDDTVSLTAAPRFSQLADDLSNPKQA